MKRIWCRPFADWLQRNDMICLCRKEFLYSPVFELKNAIQTIAILIWTILVKEVYTYFLDTGQIKTVSCIGAVAMA